MTRRFKRRAFCFTPKCRYPPEIRTRFQQVGCWPGHRKASLCVEGLLKDGSELGSLS
jgi:hypothetical protein